MHLTCVKRLGAAVVVYKDMRMSRRAKRPTDMNQLAKFIADVATGQADDQESDSGKDSAMSELGRVGGVKGGRARARSLSPEQRQEIAKRAAAARWKK